MIRLIPLVLVWGIIKDLHQGMPTLFILTYRYTISQAYVPVNNLVLGLTLVPTLEPPHACLI